jgi:hypothetical protein
MERRLNGETEPATIDSIGFSKMETNYQCIDLVTKSALTYPDLKIQT